jgi:hypothetical protein
MFPSPTIFFRKAFVLDQVHVARLVSWVHDRPLVKSFYGEDHRPLLKLCKDLRLGQWIGFVLPVLDQVEDTPSMVLVSITELKK